ncbi:uncharacterized protein LOC124302885 [Neodiprion virginianus]|uniref:uncharacterized protein LOC124180722 n=1 Tax=Neodiprion fabricii TaxID=2872261 RepID=UPI001ED9729C|nr:uncharacterized protein LOC124180722 [Neodiprion fabricii]XP_046615410.1 uncharacterized protein LOC124302885 [Neodiprion virginianus]
MQHTAGIEVRVTKELSGTNSEVPERHDDVPHWVATSAPSPISPTSSMSPTTPMNPRQYLSPHVLQGRNSLCSANDYALRRRRPMTLRIGPRLSLSNCSSSAPTTTTDADWPALSFEWYKLWKVVLFSHR